MMRGAPSVSHDDGGVRKKTLLLLRHRLAWSLVTLLYAATYRQGDWAIRGTIWSDCRDDDDVKVIWLNQLVAYHILSLSPKTFFSANGRKDENSSRCEAFALIRNRKISHAGAKAGRSGEVREYLFYYVYTVYMAYTYFCFMAPWRAPVICHDPLPPMTYQKVPHPPPVKGKNFSIASHGHHERDPSFLFMRALSESSYE